VRRDRRKGVAIRTGRSLGDLPLQASGLDRPSARAHLRQVVIDLQAQPEIGVAADRLLQAQGHFRRDPTLAVDDAVELLAGHAKALGDIGNREAKLGNLIPDPDARMRGVLYHR